MLVDTPRERFDPMMWGKELSSLVLEGRDCAHVRPRGKPLLQRIAGIYVRCISFRSTMVLTAH